MNGASATLLMWTANVLLGIVLALVGVILRMHQKNDEDQHARMDAEINLLRKRFHDFSIQVGKVDADMQALLETKQRGRA